MNDIMENVAKKFGKHDLERLGIFIEMPYLKVHRKKKKKVIIEPEIQDGFMTNPMKAKCGNQDGYFEKTFKRLHIGDKPRVVKRRSDKPTKLPFVPAGPTKQRSTPDDYYGSFFPKPLEHVPVEIRKVKKRKPKHSRDPMAGSPKKGGPGVVDITINPWPEHMTDRHAPPPLVPVRQRLKEEAKEKKIPFYTASTGGYFDDNPFFEGEDIKYKIYIRDEERKKKKEGPKKGRTKKYSKRIFIPTGPGALYDGYFETFPKYKTNRQRKKPVVVPKKGVYRPPFLLSTFQQPKTIQWTTVLQNTNLYMNPVNYQTYEPRYVTYL